MGEPLLQRGLQGVVVRVAGEIRVGFDILVRRIRTKRLAVELATRCRLQQSSSQRIVLGRELVQICSHVADLKSGNAERDVLTARSRVTDLKQCVVSKCLLEIQIPLLHVGERLIRNSALDALADERAQRALISANGLEQWRSEQRIT